MSNEKMHWAEAGEKLQLGVFDLMVIASQVKTFGEEAPDEMILENATLRVKRCIRDLMEVAQALEAKDYVKQ